ncbi:hypothetical protein MIU24_35560 [Streptomyces venezuelae]|uniref:hypothetical protein n=1 Tax=Streptomyces sp. B6(2022) TaxID=3404749 RepID=UPI00311EC509
MATETKALYGFAAALWAIVIAATLSMYLGNLTAINAIIGCSLPASVALAFAVHFHRDDRARTVARPAQHRTTLERGTRPVAEPSTPGWAEYEHDGSARAQCSCGMDTGWVATADAVSAAHGHRATTQ